MLTCFTGITSASAYVIDLSTGRCRQVWRVTADPYARDDMRRVTMVGACNGPLCLCDGTRPGGAISLLNPATRETLRVPPLPVSQYSHRTYGSGEDSFGFHPVTRRYRILHLPCRADVTGGFTALQVVTLGDPPRAWRDVPVSFPGGATATCNVEAGLVTVDGATYWVTKGGKRVVSFDHEDERVVFAAPLPVEGRPGYVPRLMEVRGRLGLAVCADRWALAKTDVWVLGWQQGLSRQSSVQV
jgi:F-box interacting protein